MELCTHRGAHPKAVPPPRVCSHPQGLRMVLHPRGQAPCHLSAANPKGAALLCKEGPPDFPGLSLLSHFVPVLHGRVYFCCYFWAITTHFEHTFVSHCFSFSPNSHFDVKPRGQTEITGPDSLRKSCSNCNTALLPNLLSKVCVSLDSSVVFSLVVWVLSLLLCHAASQLISVISAVSGHGKASKALICILIFPPHPEEQPGTHCGIKPPCPMLLFCPVSWGHYSQTERNKVIELTE